MRDLKFRGRTINGKWVYGDVALSGVAPNCSFISNLEGTFQVIPTTVGQYTGLKDKKGKEIYEGDIIVIESIHDEEKFNLPVVFKDGGFWADGSGELFLWNHNCEIIGNIYENPELLTHPAEGRN